jgi:hypothetical protein
VSEPLWSKLCFAARLTGDTLVFVPAQLPALAQDGGRDGDKGARAGEVGVAGNLAAERARGDKAHVAMWRGAHRADDDMDMRSSTLCVACPVATHGGVCTP